MWEEIKLTKCQVNANFRQTASSVHSVKELPHDNRRGLDVSKAMCEVLQLRHGECIVKDFDPLEEKSNQPAKLLPAGVDKTKGNACTM